MKRNLSGIVLLLGILFGINNLAMAQLPTITPGAIANTCAGTNSVLPYGQTGDPITYSITWSGTPVGLPDVPPGTILPTISIPIVVLSTCATGIYNGQITVTNGVGTSAPKPISIRVYALPTVFTMTGGGGFCAGGTGVHVGLSGSTSGVLYQLYRGGTTPVGSPMWGTGVALDFGFQTVAGSYTVTANDPTSTCTRNMSGVVNVAVYPVPYTQSMTGGGGYCEGGFGAPVGLSGSQFGVTYQLYRGLTPVGAPLDGTGLSLDFGAQTIGGIYTAKAIDSSYPSCPVNMSGTSGVYVYPVPAVYSVTGGGDYCAGGYGVHLGISNSNTTIRYTLYRGITPVYNVLGSGGPMDFGIYTAAGSYTVKGVNTVYGCSAVMSDTAIINLKPLVHPLVSIFAHQGTNVCANTVDTFSVDGMSAQGIAPTFQWGLNGVDLGGETGFNFNWRPNNVDNITLKMTSSEECASPPVVTATVIMNVFPRVVPTVHIFSDQGSTFTNGDNVTLHALLISPGPAPTYQWFVNGTLVAGATSSSFSSNAFNDMDSVSCRVYGCSDTAGYASMRLHVIPRVGVRTVTSSENEVKVYPNPSHGAFTLSGSFGSNISQNAQVAYKVTDLLGKEVYSGNTTLTNGQISEKIQLPATVGSGIYLLSVRTETGTIVSQIVVE